MAGAVEAKEIALRANIYRAAFGSGWLDGQLGDGHGAVDEGPISNVFSRQGRRADREQEAAAGRALEDRRQGR